MIANAAARTFEAERGPMTALAYRMLGARAEAEDVVQDAWLRWRGVDHAAIAEPRAWLATTVTRLCLDRLKSARARREVYVGPWLPEPVVDETLAADGPGELAEDLSVALMLALERLSPLERAAFILHDVFDLGFAEVARGLGRSEEACRRLASRARTHVRETRPRYPVSPEESERLVEAFHRAAALGDLADLTALLAEDAVLYSDGGGRRPAALIPIHGRDAIARLFEALARRNPEYAQSSSRFALINGDPGLVLRAPSGELTTVAFEIGGGAIQGIYIMRNPDKLAHVRF
jgi:RNA polymerase sigma-70 factor, ECF subfamily